MKLLKSTRLWVALLLLAGVVFLKTGPVAISIGGVFLVALFFRPTLRPLLNYKFWLVIVLLTVLVPVFSGEQDRVLWGISYSSTRFEQTALMALRGILLFLLFQVLTYNLDSAALTQVLRKLRIPGIDSTLPRALDIKPQVADLARSRFRAYRSTVNRTGRISSFLDAAGAFFAELIDLAHRSDQPRAPASLEPPPDLLRFVQESESPALIVVTGPSGAGKSAWLADQVRKLSEADQFVDGLLVQRIGDDPERWHQVIRRISTGEERQFNTMDELKEASHVGRFWFYPDAVTWGRQQLREASRAGCLVVDEFGLLEAAGEGWYPTLKELAQSYSGHLVIAVREQIERESIEFLFSHLPALRSWSLTTIKLPARSVEED